MEIQRICCGNVNCYIVSNGKDAILVDTGQEEYCQKVLNACKIFHMHLLVLTHGHIDHVQNAAFLANALHIPVAINQEDVPLLKDNMLQMLSSRGILGKIILSASLRSFKKDKIPVIVPTVFLNDNDVLDAYGIPAKIIALPGHTKGSIGLDIEQRNLIVGDALMNMFYPTISMLYNDKMAMVKSAEKISSLGNRTIYFGHGKPTHNRKWT
ncbi:MAG: MBL fold metallo-hydrolase [Eubacterium sp.]|nr:MBL fold metallo-hydrolase [Eubacterium sp.]